MSEKWAFPGSFALAGSGVRIGPAEPAHILCICAAVFCLKYPEHSGELLDAIEEAKRLEADPKTKRYTDMDEMWADLDK